MVGMTGDPHGDEPARPDPGAPAPDPLACVIVDDSPEFLRSATDLLEAEGMRVVGRFADGQVAAEKLDELDADVVLVDIELGLQDGVRVAAELAAARHSPPIILVSGRADFDFSAAPLPAGIVGFLAKQNLGAAAIRNLLGHNGSCGPLPDATG